MPKPTQQSNLERDVTQAEAEWKAWLLSLFGTKDDPRYIRTVHLLDRKLDAADALAGYLVDRALEGDEDTDAPIERFQN